MFRSDDAHVFLQFRGLHDAPETLDEQLEAVAYAEDGDRFAAAILKEAVRDRWAAGLVHTAVDYL